MKRPWNHWDQDNCSEVTGRARASHKNITCFAGDSKSGRSDLVGEIHWTSYNLSSNYWWRCWFCVHLQVPQSQSVPMPSLSVVDHGCVNEDSLENAAVLQDCLWAWWLRNLHPSNLTTSRSQLTSVQALLRCMWWNILSIWTIFESYYDGTILYDAILYQILPGGEAVKQWHFSGISVGCASATSTTGGCSDLKEELAGSEQPTTSWCITSSKSQKMSRKFKTCQEFTAEKPVQKHLFWVCLLSLSWSKIVVSWWIRRRMIKCRKSFGKSCAFFMLSRWVFPKLVSVSYLERFDQRQYIISVNCIWIFHKSYIHNWTINISSVIYDTCDIHFLWSFSQILSWILWAAGCQENNFWWCNFSMVFCFCTT